MDERERISKRVIEAVASFGGETVKNIVVWHLRNTYSLDPSDALCRTEAFVKALSDIYGQFAYVIIEKICEEIANEYGLKYSSGGLVKLSSEINFNCG